MSLKGDIGPFVFVSTSSGASEWYLMGRESVVCSFDMALPAEISLFLPENPLVFWYPPLFALHYLFWSAGSSFYENVALSQFQSCWFLRGSSLPFL